MIVPARRRAPRSQNYRTGVWSGMGAIAEPLYEQCAITDSACVARNLVKQNDFLAAQFRERNAASLDQCLKLGWPAAGCYATFGPGGTAEATGNAGEPVQGYVPQSFNQAFTQSPSGGHVTFTSSRGSNALQVGDTWLVSITGATPGKAVTAKVGTDVTPMGTTDAAGNFTLAGAARTADVGAWNESWFVGGVPSGSFSFTVQAAVTPEGKKVINSSGAESGTGTGGDAGTGAGSGSGAGTGNGATADTGGFSFAQSFKCTDPTTCWFGFPKWAVLGAGTVAAFFMFGKGGR